jgi:all-trans-retinol 13,14-reductase
MHTDTIVIGSGAGGLAAALCLARAGQKVILLEQHYVPGGWCHSFYLNGQRFSPGVHYLGRVGEGDTTSAMLKGLGIANELVFFRMNPKGYEHVLIGKEKFDLPAGADNLLDTLGARFPEEKDNLRKYLRLVYQVSHQLYLIPQMSGFWDNITIPFRTAQLGKYGLFTLKRVIDWHIKDPLLKQVLNVQCGDYGLPPGRASFPLHCAAMDHYIEGGFYPMGGGAALVKAFTSGIKKYGGEIRTGLAVKRILIEKEGKKRVAKGVEMADGGVITADRVVSNADPGKTYLDLVGKENLSPKLYSRLQKTRYSVTSLILFVTIDIDLRAAGLDSGNIWAMPPGDLDALFQTMSADDIVSGDHFPGFFISCSTLKDPSGFNGRYYNLEVITFIDYKTFRSFAGEDVERSPEYLKYKDQLARKLLNSLETVVPGVKDHVVQMDFM